MGFIKNTIERLLMKPQITDLNATPDGVALTVNCIQCGGSHQVNIKEDELINWLAGDHIQDAMPDLSASERELLISGTCDKCWKDMFSFDEEDTIKKEDEQ